VAKVLRPIGHEDKLTIVDHLDELRSRLIVCVIALAVAFGVCFWQNHALLTMLGRALPHSSSTTGQHGLAAVPTETAQLRQAFSIIERGASTLAVSRHLSPADRQSAALMAQGARDGAKALPGSASPKEKPITIGVGEPFMTTLTVVAYFAVLFALPVLIYEGYGFVFPALKPEERRAVWPAMIAAPVLFVIGVVFAYLVVLPPAVHFLQGYNSDQFDILVQAKSYYTFQLLTMLGIGVAFQLPLGLLALHRVGVVDGRTLTKHWRYGIVIMAVVAAALPGADPVTTALETVPLVILYLASIVTLKFADRRAAARAAAELSQMGDGLEIT